MDPCMWSTWTPGARQRDFLYGGEEGPCKDIAINFDNTLISKPSIVTPASGPLHVICLTF